MARRFFHTLALLFFITCAAPVSAAPATFEIQIVPDYMELGQPYRVLLRYKNTSSKPWDASKLVLQSRSPNLWGVNLAKAMQTSTIAPGASATFRFNVAAPSSVGRHPFSWALGHADDGLLHPGSPVVLVEVSSSAHNHGAEFIYQEMPNIMDRGEIRPITILFKNTGQTTWKAPNIHLGIRNADGTLAWALDKVAMDRGEAVPPGEVKAFKFNISAPNDSGIFLFQTQMQTSGNAWFGETSEVIKVLVN